MTVSTIDDVLTELRAVVDDCIAGASRLGLFATVYRQVTAAVARAIDDGVFDDADRLGRFDAIFAGRYLDALRAWREGTEMPRSWRLAFRAGEDDRTVLVQHVVLGVNAHINLDLAVAAAQTCPGEEIADLRDDFERICDVLTGVLCDLQGALDDVSPLLGGLDAVLGRIDEEILGFALGRAREAAWEAAVLLAGQDGPGRAATERMLDRYASGVGRVVLAPPFPLPAALELIRFTERRPLPEVIGHIDRALGL